MLRERITKTYRGNEQVALTSILIAVIGGSRLVDAAGWTYLAGPRLSAQQSAGTRPQAQNSSITSGFSSRIQDSVTLPSLMWKTCA